ncbi:MAG: pyridoxamine 5'-phosphate oxidase family protein [Dokdonella sp.]|uniref:pyridoxamine 5'-phosphate oxidase family protein n=1 Tax=Dokdonella sp. TaxID=2291710 RepID=UPI0025C1DF1A|nr:pyridoxamine 5'-phosphate oxidase family protein [Dokdonella sp.]MBZ0223223.1 pyridoxamine 5'-phosphate oxidase family protein [Dokdonella sp.]MCC7255827.1 pyridoxamine 5'-phosphate oxidase family protein [Dokdonella sp.]
MPTATPPRHHVHRSKQRAAYDRSLVHAILDAGLLAHVGFSVDGQPFVIPMLYARDGDALLLHGAVASRLMRALGSGIEACASITHLDGLVIARSQFNHSANYRSVVVFGRATAIEDASAKAAALTRLVDALIPGRAAESRPADRKELAATSVLRLDIVDASAKVRSGDAEDKPEDLALPYWAGVLPLHQQAQAPIANADLDPGIAVPASIHRFSSDPRFHA